MSTPDNKPKCRPHVTMGDTPHKPTRKSLRFQDENMLPGPCLTPSPTSPTHQKKVSKVKTFASKFSVVYILVCHCNEYFRNTL